MDKEDRKEPIDLEASVPDVSEEPVRLSDSILERRRRRYSFRSDGIGDWKNLHGVELPDAPFPSEIAMEEDFNDPIEEAEEMADEDFLV